MQNWSVVKLLRIGYRIFLKPKRRCMKCSSLSARARQRLGVVHACMCITIWLHEMHLQLGMDYVSARFVARLMLASDFQLHSAHDRGKPFRKAAD